MLTTAVVPWSTSHSLHYYVCAGVVFSNICHLLSVLALYRLTDMVFDHQRTASLPYVASILYIVSPAGMFLSAPYAESLFALLNFTGMFLYGRAKTPDRRSQNATIGDDLSVVGSAMIFILATWVRSNGILSGLLFVFDAVFCLAGMQRGESEIRRLVVTCVSGALLGIGALLPQYVAYRTYCASDFETSARPWCYKPLPSIYTWVQSHYWLVLPFPTNPTVADLARNVGFLRYWTLPNLPLFLIAAPVLWLLIQSSIAHLRHSFHHVFKPSRTKSESEAKSSKDLCSVPSSLPEFALPQLILAVTAATNFHVQVINRLSSGYPIWYLAVARWIVAQNNGRAGNSTLVDKAPQWITRGIIMYALVQGALFANFLPPA